MIESPKLAGKFLVLLGFDLIILWGIIFIAAVPVFLIRQWWRDTHLED